MEISTQLCTEFTAKLCVGTDFFIEFTICHFPQIHLFFWTYRTFPSGETFEFDLMTDSAYFWNCTLLPHARIWQKAIPTVRKTCSFERYNNISFSAILKQSYSLCSCADSKYIQKFIEALQYILFSSGIVESEANNSKHANTHIKVINLMFFKLLIINKWK